MGIKTGLAAICLMLSVGFMSHLASQKYGQADTTGALAAAVREDTVDLIGDITFAVDDPAMMAFYCIKHSEKLDYPKLASLLDDTILKPVRMSECSSKTVQIDGGMFSEITLYYGPDGSQAFDIELVKIDCHTSNHCEIDLDNHGRGDTYVVRKSGDRWQVTDRRMRWVV